MSWKSFENHGSASYPDPLEVKPANADRSTDRDPVQKIHSYRGFVPLRQSRMIVGRVKANPITQMPNNKPVTGSIRSSLLFLWFKISEQAIGSAIHHLQHNRRDQRGQARPSTRERECLFGEIRDDWMRLNEARQMIGRVWAELAARFPFVTLDESMIMRNHFHGIVRNHRRRGESCIRPESGWGDHKDQGDHKDRPYGTAERSLGAIVQAFKSITNHRYTIGVKAHDWQPFPGRLWQRNYYDHVIRNEDEWNRIRDYLTR